jgi:hypothetical protein
MEYVNFIRHEGNSASFGLPGLRPAGFMSQKPGYVVRIKPSARIQNKNRDA